jgi:hypothetical protein
MRTYIQHAAVSIKDFSQQVQAVIVDEEAGQERALEMYVTRASIHAQNS